MNKKCNQYNLCEAVGYSKKATICIQIYGRDKINMVYSCKSCAKMFADPLCSCKRCTKATKKTLERDVQPGSNVSHIQPYQQSGGVVR